MRRRLGRGVLVVAVVAVVVVAGFGAWLSWTFHTLDSSRPPPVIRVFGREFRASDETWTLARAEAASAVPPDILHPSLGALPVLLPLEPNSLGSGMFPTVIFLETGPDAYLVYSLLGGP